MKNSNETKINFAGILAVSVSLFVVSMVAVIWMSQFSNSVEKNKIAKTLESTNRIVAPTSPKIVRTNPSKTKLTPNPKTEEVIVYVHCTKILRSGKGRLNEMKEMRLFRWSRVKEYRKYFRNSSKEMNDLRAAAYRGRIKAQKEFCNWNTK